MSSFEENLNKHSYYLIDKKSSKKDYVFVEGPYGEHEVRICSLRKGGIPTIQTSVDKNEHFRLQATEIHGDLYNYDKTNYINKRTKVIINCPEHGNFYQGPSEHLKGRGCPKCGYNKIGLSRRDGVCGWGLSDWKNLAYDSNRFDNFKLYIIKCFSEDETFIKIGRTFLTLGNRFRSSTALPYSYILIEQVIGSADYIFNLEWDIKRILKSFSYKPKNKFNGMHECYSLNALEHPRVKQLLTSVGK